MANKYYAVIKGRVKKPIIYDNWNDCKKATHKYKGSKYRSFKTKQEAQDYINANGLGYKSVSKKKKKHPVEKAIGKDSKRSPQICIVCEAPYESKYRACNDCRKKILKHNVNVKSLLFIKNLYKSNDIWALVENKPEIIHVKYEKSEINKIINEMTNKIKDEKSANSPYGDLSTEIPDYIMNLFKERQDVEFLKLTGDRLKPKIHYKCKECGKKLTTSYVKNKFNHNCPAKKSSGEIAIENYLKGRIGYCTQRKTLKCYNPITGSILPYDFEIPSLRTIIEVQGKQHDEFVPFFHKSQEDFEYQIFKDQVKKEFAESSGYDVIYITYKDIETGRYKERLSKLLTAKG